MSLARIQSYIRQLDDQHQGLYASTDRQKWEQLKIFVESLAAHPPTPPALSAAPAIGDELRDTLVAVSAAIAERDDRAAQKMIREILAASPTPPAEQQAQPGAVYAELPQPDSWFHFTAQFWENKLRDFADRTHALRMQAAPKAAPTRTALPEGWTDCTIEFGNDGPEVVAYGPKRMMTRLAKWLGKYFAQVIAEAAPKAAPGEQNTVPAEWLEQAYREGWAACRDAETIGEEAEYWAFGNSTANSRMIDAQQAAPKQEVQEPHGWLYEWTHSSATGKPDSTYTAFTTDEAHARKHDNCRAIYTAPQPAPATQQAGDVVAYLDVGASGYLDLGAALSEDALQQLPKGRHALVIAGTYGIDGYVAAPQPSPTTKPAPQQEAQEPGEIPESIERMATGRYKVVPSHESMFHRWAVVAGSGTQQLYLGSEVECQNMARKFAGAFLDGAFVTMQSTSPNPAPAPLSDDVVKDAARWRMAALIGNEVMLHPDKRTHATAVKAYMDATHSGSDLTGAVDAAIAAQGGKDAG